MSFNVNSKEATLNWTSTHCEQENNNNSNNSTDRGSFPGHPAGLVWAGTQLFESQGGDLSRERIVVEKPSALKAVLPQSLVVLVQVTDGLAVGTNTVVPVTVVLQPGCNASHDIAS